MHGKRHYASDLVVRCWVAAGEEKNECFSEIASKWVGGRAEAKSTAGQELAWSQALFVPPSTWSFVRMHARVFIKTRTTVMHASRHTCLNHVSIPSLSMKYLFCSFVLRPPRFHIQSWACAYASLSMHELGYAAHRTRVNSMLVGCGIVWRAHSCGPALSEATSFVSCVLPGLSDQTWTPCRASRPLQCQEDGWTHAPRVPTHQCAQAHVKHSGALHAHGRTCMKR